MQVHTRIIQPLVAAALACGFSLLARAQIGSGWTPTTESYVIQTLTGCTATPNSTGGGTFTVPVGSGRAEFRFQNLSTSTTEQFQGDFTADSLAGDRVTCKQTFGPAPSTPWNIIDVTKANGGEFIEIEGGAVLAPYTIGTTVRMNTIYDPAANTVDVYINGVHVEQKGGNPPPHYNKIGAYVSQSGTGPATYTWQNIQFWTGGTASGGGGQFTISTSAAANGSISPSATVNQGDSATITITPDASFVVQDVLVDGTSVGAVTSVPFTNVQANHTVSASFVSSGGGSVDAPTFSKPEGTYKKSVHVRIKDATSGATVRYTLDGSIPTQTNGTIIPNGTLRITSTATLQAVAYTSSGISSVTSATYTIK